MVPGKGNDTTFHRLTIQKATCDLMATAAFLTQMRTWNTVHHAWMGGSAVPLNFQPHLHMLVIKLKVHVLKAYQMPLYNVHENPLKQLHSTQCIAQNQRS